MKPFKLVLPLVFMTQILFAQKKAISVFTRIDKKALLVFEILVKKNY